MASEKDVESKLRELMARLEDSAEAEDSLRSALPESRILALHVEDLDAHFWAELAEGRMRGLERGRHPDPHIVIRAESEELVNLINGNGQVLSSYLLGRIRIDASVSDMLQLRKML